MTRKFLKDGEFDLPKLEEEVLKFWDEEKIFEKSLAENQLKGGDAEGSNTFVFYEGPPYANGKPAMHHVLARVVKDVMLRYKTMRGYYVPRRAGWDTHGLPVEMAAEKVLGFKSKRDIEQYGVQRFNEEAKKQVWINKDEWERLTNRIGYWLDLKDAYVTYSPEYIETVWWILAQIYKRDLLYKGHKVVPWCTRCGTALSSHELAQGYKEVIDKSVYVKFYIKDGQKFGKYSTEKGDVYILSWTTTPWTLPGNVALAVGEKISYTALHVKDNKELYILASDLVKTVFKDQEVEIVHDDIQGKDLVGLEYEPLFEVAPLRSEKSYKIYPADFVTTTDGTGVVHTAVMYGEDDYELGKKVGLPQHHTVNEEGKFMKDVPVLEGEYAKGKETEEHIFEHLRAHNTLLRIQEYKHEYPFCWRCGTAILYYARTSWFIGMSKLRRELQERNETIHWMPEHVKEGRFGEWLKEAKDWNLSRERYWGAPLPIWECAKCHHTEVVESLERMSELAGGAKNTYWAVRHGESENVVLHILDSGDQNFHLTERGREQVAKTAQKLKADNIDLIFASDLARTKETATIIAEALGIEKIHFDERLREINLASLSGQPSVEYKKEKPNEEEKFGGHVVSGAESLRDVRTRMWHFLQEMEEKHHGKNILIVSHEDAIWMLSEAALGWSEHETAKKKNSITGRFMEPADALKVDLKAIPRDATGLVDLHRPYVDDVVLSCPSCHAPMKRVPTVADVWFDSGAMPYAQNHFPFAAGQSVAEKPPLFPADYIAEGMDQTRGWFYTMLAIATALGYEAPYRNVITFGLMNDKFGNKMSKSKGNVIEPFAIIDKYGVDSVRWYFFAGTPFGEPKNFDELEVGKKLRQVHLIIYNSFVFWKTYARPVEGEWKSIAQKSENILDQWIVARLNELTAAVTKKLDAYQIREATFDIEAFVDDLSRWYIRRSRKRLQRPESDTDYEAASATLGFALRELVTSMAPFTPFFAEVLHAEIGAGKESVHLETWPTAGEITTADEKIIEQMRAVRELAALGLAKRAEVKMKVRQPLASMTISVDLDSGMQKILADEVNVKKIIVATGAVGVELDTALTHELREEGTLREIARMVQELRQKAGLEPKDEIALMLSVPEDVRMALQKHEIALKADIGASLIEYQKSDKFEAEEAAKVDGQEVWIGLRKV